MLSNVFPQINPLSSVPQALHNSASFGACNVTITLQGSFASRSSGCKVMGGWLVDFQECLLSGRGWRRKEPKRNACKFNDIAGTSEAFQHTDTHRQRSRNCSGEIWPCQFLWFYRESCNFQSVLKSPAAGVIPLSGSLSFLLNEKECFQPSFFFPRGNLEKVKYTEGSEMEGKENPGHIKNKQKTNVEMHDQKHAHSVVFFGKTQCQNQIYCHFHLDNWFADTCACLSQPCTLASQRLGWLQDGAGGRCWGSTFALFLSLVPIFICDL